MATIWSSPYTKADVCFTKDGGAVSVAINGSNVAYSKRSTDGVTWPADGSAVSVGSVATRKVRIHQKHESGSSRLVVIAVRNATDTTDLVWHSDTYGKTWSSV